VVPSNEITGTKAVRALPAKLTYLPTS
jgi:hypothetical protein